MMEKIGWRGAPEHSSVAARAVLEPELPEADLHVGGGDEQLGRLRRLQDLHRALHRAQPQRVRPVQHCPEPAHQPAHVQLGFPRRRRRRRHHHARVLLRHHAPLQLVDLRQLRRAEVAQVPRPHAQEEVRQLRLEPAAGLRVEQVDQRGGAPPGEPVRGAALRGAGPRRRQRPHRVQLRARRAVGLQVGHEAAHQCLQLGRIVGPAGRAEVAAKRAQPAEPEMEPLGRGLQLHSFPKRGHRQHRARGAAGGSREVVCVKCQRPRVGGGIYRVRPRHRSRGAEANGRLRARAGRAYEVAKGGAHAGAHVCPEHWLSGSGRRRRHAGQAGRVVPSDMWPDVPVGLWVW
uniref:Uncharacterized protein n=1 Tax=Setaria italica TaxID=4555 RepID=K3Z7N4_SETIT